MILKTVGLKVYSMWLALVLAGGSPLSILAHTDRNESDIFRAINGVEEIVPEGCYLIGAEFAVRFEGGPMRGFCLLTNEQITTNLVGKNSTYPIARNLKEDEERCFWNFRFNEKGEVFLYSPVACKGIGEGKGASHLQMTSDDWAAWTVQEEENGVFVLRKSDDKSRALGLNWMPEGARFGCYSFTGLNPVRLRLYKQVCSSVDLPGEAVLPQNGRRVALVVDAKLVLRKEGEKVRLEAVQDYLLQDNSLAVEDGTPSWICHWRDNGTFELLDEENRGLDVLYPNLPVRQLWTIENGYVVTSNFPLRYLVADKEGHAVLKTQDELKDMAYHPVLLLPEAQPADSLVNDHGVKVLSGGWNALNLASVSWDGVNALDLTQIALPVSPRKFSNWPKEKTPLLYVSEKGVDNCPSEWKNLVVCGTDGVNRLVTNLRLTDDKCLALDRAINISDVEVSYYRKAYADGGWETLCLPFDGSIPTWFQAEHLIDYSNADNVLVFEPTDKIVPHVPIVFRYEGVESEDGVDFEVMAQSNWLTPDPQLSDLFKGTYSSFVVPEDKDCAYYLLDEKGKNFVRASAESRLAPYRSYIVKGGDASRIRVKHGSIATGITTLCQDAWEEGAPCYSITGRLLTPSLTQRSWNTMPKGVYIINGKKYLK